VGEAAAESGDRLFCVGNPSNVDLEELWGASGETEFEPPTWHTSAGSCQGYLDLAAQTAQHEQSQRGRAPTRGEQKRAHGTEAVDAERGGMLMHSCWTYWGHSGAQLARHGIRVYLLVCTLRTVPRTCVLHSLHTCRCAALQRERASGWAALCVGRPYRDAPRPKDTPLAYGDT
jgi:hypothetical protein